MQTSRKNFPRWYINDFVSSHNRKYTPYPLSLSLYLFLLRLIMKCSLLYSIPFGSSRFPPHPQLLMLFFNTLLFFSLYSSSGIHSTLSHTARHAISRCGIYFCCMPTLCLSFSTLGRHLSFFCEYMCIQPVPLSLSHTNVILIIQRSILFSIFF